MNLTHPVILGIETSCDETAAAVIDGDSRVRASLLSSQHDIHGHYGGVVPELAARRHIEVIEGIVRQTLGQAEVHWTDVSAIAVTCGPGLAGALLVGVCFAKALAYARRVPLLAVHHLEAHMASAWMDSPDLPMPCVMLVVSGGHTHLFFAGARGDYRLIGRTLDDAAGEAFDKGAKMLGLGYPGGPVIDRLAQSGNPQAVVFPRPYPTMKTLNFSFSGLKTALRYYLSDLDRQQLEPALPDIAAGFQEAIVDVLVEKTVLAAERYQARSIAVVGGVSANSRLRARFKERAARLGVTLAIPKIGYCTDNAAMVGMAGLDAYRQGRFSSWDLEVSPALAVPGSDTLMESVQPRRRPPIKAARGG